jgi:hypothetical protein
VSCICHDPSTFGHTECGQSPWFGLDAMERWKRHERDDDQRRVWSQEMALKPEPSSQPGLLGRLWYGGTPHPVAVTASCLDLCLSCGKRVSHRIHRAFRPASL